MQKPKEYNLADSNIANLGTDLEKKVREAAARNEPAWTNAGKKVGLEIWRIEKFQVVVWPKSEYGKFFSGDSYIVLNTFKNATSDKLCYDVHFWLGKYTTQDEAGTAAYKTVELDDFLGGAPVQHREVQGHESSLFLSYFQNQITIMDGGVDTGFKHVEPEKYRPRLLHLKGIKKVRVSEVEMARSSLNSGDVFVLDLGLQVYQFNGKESGPMEKFSGGKLCKAIQDERKGVKVVILEEGKKSADMTQFFSHLGGEGPIKTAAEGGSDKDAEVHPTRVLFRLSDASGQLEFTKVAEGNQVTRDKFISDDVFIFDTGFEIFGWIGKSTSSNERKNWLHFTGEYIKRFNRPLFTPVTRIMEGGENEVFESLFV